MATVTDFRDFEAFKACRAFAREIGLLIRTRKFVPNRRLVDQMERAPASKTSAQELSAHRREAHPENRKRLTANCKLLTDNR